jgi:hypothetical protein
MHRRIFLASPFLAMVTLDCSAAAPWTLLTPDEVVRFNTPPGSRGLLPNPPAVRGVPPGPQIVVGQPPGDAPLRAPITFRLRFVPETGSKIDQRTFRATYGSLGLDITSRLLQHARFTGEELLVDSVNIPAGNHVVTLAIADTRGHEASRTFQFTVV